MLDLTIKSLLAIVIAVELLAAVSPLLYVEASIIPSKGAAKIMGSNIAHFDRFTFELKLFEEIISVPTLVIGIN